MSDGVQVVQPDRGTCAYVGVVSSESDSSKIILAAWPNGMAARVLGHQSGCMIDVSRSSGRWAKCASQRRSETSCGCAQT